MRKKKDDDETTINDELVVTPHAPRETPATAADVFLRGPILDAVQRSRVYGDGKAFVDMPLKVAPGQALSAFRSVYAGDKDELRQFIEAHFGAAGSDLMRAPLPKDWTPEFPQRVDADHVELMAAIHAMWPKLLRVSRDDFPESRTLIARRFTFVVPGGRMTRSLLTPNSCASPMMPVVLVVGLSGLLKPSRLLEVASWRVSPKCQTPANPSAV